MLNFAAGTPKSPPEKDVIQFRKLRETNVEEDCFEMKKDRIIRLLKWNNLLQAFVFTLNSMNPNRSSSSVEASIKYNRSKFIKLFID